MMLTFFVVSCAEDKNALNNSIEKKTLVNWITGSYSLKSDYGNYSELWKKHDSATYYGFGYFMDIENEDTLFKQRMKLQETSEGVFMFFNVKNQNDNKEVEFRLTKHENNTFTFENPFRDYPSIITYKIITDSTVNVVMHGFKNGKEKGEDFVIKK